MRQLVNVFLDMEFVLIPYESKRPFEGPVFIFQAHCGRPCCHRRRVLDAFGR